MSISLIKLFGLEKTCSKDDIKKKFKDFALIFHPDKYNCNKLVEQVFKTVQGSYNDIINNSSTNSFFINKSLKSENDSLRSSNDQLKKENESLNKENKILNKEKEEFKRENDQLKRTNDILTQKYVDLEKKNLKSENEMLRSCNDELRSVVKEMVREYTDLEKKYKYDISMTNSDNDVSDTFLINKSYNDKHDIDKSIKDEHHIDINNYKINSKYYE